MHDCDAEGAVLNDLKRDSKSVYFLLKRPLKTVETFRTLRRSSSFQRQDPNLKIKTVLTHLSFPIPQIMNH